MDIRLILYNKLGLKSHMITQNSFLKHSETTKIQIYFLAIYFINKLRLPTHIISLTSRGIGLPNKSSYICKIRNFMRPKHALIGRISFLNPKMLGIYV